MHKFTLAVFAAVLFIACKKDAGDSTSPVITVSSPSNHQIFTAGQTATVSATITDNDAIHEVHLYVTNKASNAQVLHFEEHTDSKTYTLLKTFAVQAGITYHIEIQANDHGDNESSVELDVSGN